MSIYEKEGAKPCISTCILGESEGMLLQNIRLSETTSGAFSGTFY